MDTIIKARSMDKIPSKKGETQAQNPRGHRCKKLLFFFFKGGGVGNGDTENNTREKKSGAGREKAEWSAPEIKEGEFLSLEHHKAAAPEKAENEDGGQDFNSAMFSEAEPQWRGGGKGQIKC